jgi:effector-binding domain-containing protein
MRKTQFIGLCLIMIVIGISLCVFAEVKTDTPSNVYLKKTEPRTYAIMKHKGPYDGIPAVIAKLMKEINEGGYHMTGPVMCSYFNSPQEVPEGELLWEVRIPVVYPGRIGTVENDKMGFGYSNPVHVAYIYHVGPYETIGEKYKILFEWVGKRKYTVQSSPVELFWSDPQQTPKEKLVTEIWLPVEEKEIPGQLR